MLWPAVLIHGFFRTTGGHRLGATIQSQLALEYILTVGVALAEYSSVLEKVLVARICTGHVTRLAPTNQLIDVEAVHIFTTIVILRGSVRTDCRDLHACLFRTVLHARTFVRCMGRVSSFATLVRTTNATSPRRPKTGLAICQPTSEDYRVSSIMTSTLLRGTKCPSWHPDSFGLTARVHQSAKPLALGQDLTATATDNEEK